MTEKLLQFIWQFQYFNTSDLKTASGEALTILFAGKLNTEQGPDFTDARIRIDGTTLAGSVELHLKTSQWMEHGHQHDRNYDNVILHVVYEHNQDHGDGLPVLELGSRISRLLVDRYAALMQSAGFIPCGPSIAGVSQLVWSSWKERLLAERLTRKSQLVFDFLKQNNTHWEETFWWLLARGFGMKTNADAFEAMARSLPVALLARHKNQIHQLEALLFGQAGLLRHDYQEAYPRLLKKEYAFLKKKYLLQPIFIPVHFLRMRPGNFPTLRLAQLAALLQAPAHLFKAVLTEEELSVIKKLLDATANDYWHYHYRFDEVSEFRKKTIGKEMAENLIINTVIPVLFAYGLYHHNEPLRQKALRWLEQLDAERNAITKGFAGLNLPNRTAYDSQALIELKSQYCDDKRCLQCAVGNALLKQPDQRTERAFL